VLGIILIVIVGLALMLLLNPEASERPSAAVTAH